MPASASTDFQYLLLSVLFLQARPMALASLLHSLYCPIPSSPYCLSLPLPVSNPRTEMTMHGYIEVEAYTTKRAIARQDTDIYARQAWGKSLYGAAACMALISSR